MATIPTTLVAIPTVDLEPGNLVGTGLLDDLGQNNNLLGARYTAPLGAACFPVGLQPGTASGSHLEHLRFLVPASADTRGLVAYVRVDPGASDGTVRIESAGDSSKRATQPLTGGTGEQWVTLAIAASRGVDDTIGFWASGTTLKAYSVVLAWAQDTSGSVANLDVLPSGFRWVNDTGSGDAEPETDEDKPVTDELLNRMLTNPRILWEDRRAAVFSAHEDLQDGTPRWTVTNGSSRDAILQAFVPFRYSVRVRWYVQLRSTTTTWSVTMTDTSNPSAAVTITQGSTSESWGGVTWYKAGSAQTIERGEHVIKCEISGAPGTLTIDALVGVVEV